MIHYRKSLVCLLFVAALLMTAGEYARGSVLPENKVDQRVESKAVLLIQELQKQGFEVKRGYFKLWTIEDCDYTANIMGTCYGNNPAAPYVITTLPPWPEEAVDPVMSNIWGPSEEGYHDIYRFDPREAIVILGLLPPPGSYFSEQTWLFTRKEALRTDSSTYDAIMKSELLSPFLPLFFSTVPGHDDRAQALSSLSNIVNNVVIERQSGAAFNQVRYFIITPDQVMDRAVRNAFAGISVKDRDVFTERIPSDMRVGLESSADDFSTWIRYAHPRDGGRPGTPSDTWRNELPLVVLRVRDTGTNREPEQYPPVVLEDRSVVDERPLQSDLEGLLFAVSRRWEQPCASTNCSDRAGTFADLQTSPTNMVGPSCIPIGENCLFDTQDTSYQLYGRMSLDNGEVYAVAGTLGTETGNATYVGFGINQVSKLKGVADLSQEDLRGTAKAYAREVNNTHKFYLYYFTRDCSGIEGLTHGNCLSLQESLIPQGDRFAISIREYIKPGTQRGPDSSKVLPSTIMQLQRPQRADSKK
jgi:hypothetical protein